MEEKTFNKAENLKFRIKSLQLVRKQLDTSYNKETLSISLTASILGQQNTIPIHSNVGFLIEQIADKEDFKCILNAIDRRIDELYKEFYNL